ncbi:MAG TPA: hypothetical protein VGT05_03500 [Patescibacteria group bacterium]|nr:hypothetical protein [Patescibacteria group bacterium]
MDSNIPSPLTPKLQEAYDKVMGVKLNNSQTPPAPSQPTSPVNPTISPSPLTASDPLDVSSSPAQSTGQIVVDTASATATVTPDNSVATEGFSADKQKKKISPAILIAGGIALLIIYTIVCIKVMNLHVAYINP